MKRVIKVILMVLFFSSTICLAQNNSATFCGIASGPVSKDFFQSCDSLSMPTDASIFTGTYSILHKGSWSEPFRFFGKLSPSAKTKINSLHSGEKIEFQMKYRLRDGRMYTQKLIYVIE